MYFVEIVQDIFGDVENHFYVVEKIRSVGTVIQFPHLLPPVATGQEGHNDVLMLDIVLKVLEVYRYAEVKGI